MTGCFTRRLFKNNMPTGKLTPNVINYSKSAEFCCQSICGRWLERKLQTWNENSEITYVGHLINQYVLRTRIRNSKAGNRNRKSKETSEVRNVDSIPSFLIFISYFRFLSLLPQWFPIAKFRFLISADFLFMVFYLCHCPSSCLLARVAMPSGRH